MEIIHLLEILSACFQFFEYCKLKLNEKYLNSCDVKGYVRRKLKYIIDKITKAKAFPEISSESGFIFLRYLLFLVFILLLGDKILEENGVRV